MSALVIALLIFAFLGLGFLAVEAHKMDMAALNAKWQAKYDEDTGDLGEEITGLEVRLDAAKNREAAANALLAIEREDHANTHGDAEWERIRATVMQAELDRHFLMPTIDGLRAAHRDLAPVVPIGGRG